MSHPNEHYYPNRLLYVFVMGIYLAVVSAIILFIGMIAKWENANLVSSITLVVGLFLVIGSLLHAQELDERKEKNESIPSSQISHYP